jgi:hypothetical protein
MICFKDRDEVQSSASSSQKDECYDPMLQDSKRKEFHSKENTVESCRDKNDTNSNNKHIKNIKDSKLLTPATSWKIEETICILSHFRFLKREIYLKPLVDLFFQNGDFDEDDMEEILHQQTRRRQCVDIFLRKLLRLKTGSFDIFLRFLRQTEQEHIANELEMAPSVCEGRLRKNIGIVFFICLSFHA